MSGKIFLGFSNLGQGAKVPSMNRGVVIFVWSITVSFWTLPFVEAQDRIGSTVLLESPSLSVSVRDNSESPQVLSGIQSLFHREASAHFDAYDPDTPGASAGLNFEHIISGHRSPNNKFTPRHGRYRLIRESETSTVLVRDEQDSPWRVSSRFRYQLDGADSIDFDFKCQFHDPALFGDRNYAIFFFANYMNDVIDSALHFRGVASEGGMEQWIRGDAPAGHPDYNGGGTYRHANAADLEYDDDVEFRLNSWSYEYPRFSQPFYFGKAANGMCLILMFDKGPERNEEMRFSLFKFKLKQFPRPAWDFQFVVREIEKFVDYGFSGRLVWKPFVSAEDCAAEYERWVSTRL